MCSRRNLLTVFLNIYTLFAFRFYHLYNNIKYNGALLIIMEFCENKNKLINTLMINDQMGIITKIVLMNE